MDAIRLGIQIIYQDLSLFPNLTVEENLAMNTLLERRRRWVIRRTAPPEPGAPGTGRPRGGDGGGA